MVRKGSSVRVRLRASSGIPAAAGFSHSRASNYVSSAVSMGRRRPLTSTRRSENGAAGGQPREGWATAFTSKATRSVAGGCLRGAALAMPASAGAITSAQCQARVNDTPSKLVECIQTGDLSSPWTTSAGDRRRQSRARWASVAQLGGARLQGVRRLCRPERCRTPATTSSCRSTSSTTTPTPASRR